MKTTKLKDRLRGIIAIRGVGVNELERAIGAGRGSISKTLNRDDPTLTAERGRRLARILRVRYEWLMFGEDPMEPGEPNRRRGKQPTVHE